MWFKNYFLLRDSPNSRHNLYCGTYFYSLDQWNISWKINLLQTLTGICLWLTAKFLLRCLLYVWYSREHTIIFQRLVFIEWCLISFRLTDSSLIAMIHPHSVSICTLSAHWLVYFNSSINPIIYNFMSGKPWHISYRKIMGSNQPH